SSDVCSSDLFLFFLISHFFTYFLHRANYVFSFDKDIIFFILSASSFLDSFLSWRACSSFLISRCIFSSVDKVTFKSGKCLFISLVIFFSISFLLYHFYYNGHNLLTGRQRSVVYQDLLLGQTLFLHTY